MAVLVVEAEVVRLVLGWRDLLLAFGHLLNCVALRVLQESLCIHDRQLPFLEECIYLLGVDLELLQVASDRCPDEVRLLID